MCQKNNRSILTQGLTLSNEVAKLFFGEAGVAAEGFEAEAGDGAVGEGAAEVTGGHLLDAVAGEVHHGVGWGEVGYGGWHGMGIVGAT